MTPLTPSYTILKSHDVTTDVELIVGTKKFLMDVYAIGSNSGPNFSKFLQDRFLDSQIPINIWSDNSQGKSMGSVRKFLHAYGVGSKQSEAHKQNQNPGERRIQ